LPSASEMKRVTIERNILLTKFVVSLIGIWLFIFCGDIDAEGADWKWRYFYFSKDTEISYYYNVEGITFPSPGNVRVWLKNVDKQGDYKKCLIELNCKERMYTFLAIISYTKEDHVKYGSTYLTNWESFSPGSFLNFLSTIVCP
jgi:hypothetical protein